MDIVPIRPDHIERLWAIYRSQVALVPHCRFVPDLASFRDDVLMLTPRLRTEGQHFDVLVAEANGACEGFTAFTTCIDEDEQYQALTGLFVATEAAAHALVQACEERASANSLIAFPPTHGNTIVQTYNVGWDALSSYVSGVAGVLAQHGFTPFTRELSMIAPLTARLDLNWSLPLELIGPHQQAAPYAWSQIVRVMDGENRVGYCSFSDLSPVTKAPGANQTGYIWGLGVNDSYRRRGIARALVLAAMKQLQKQGCTECWLTTTADNWAAQPLYYALGFEVVDCSVSFQKHRRSS